MSGAGSRFGSASRRRRVTSRVALSIVLLASSALAVQTEAESLAASEEERSGPLEIRQLAAAGDEDGTTADAAPSTGLVPAVSEGPVDEVELLATANLAYEEGDYARAAALYERLLEERTNAWLHYNLGNARLRSGELGRAIASYRRALALQPRNADARANLAFARQSARDAIEPPGPGPLLRTLFFWHWALGPAESVRWGALANLLFWALLGVTLLRPGAELVRGGAAALLVVTLALLGSAAVHALGSGRVAVVVPQQVDVYSGTDTESVVRFQLHAGTEVRLRGEREDWVRIVLPDGEQGWLERDYVEIAP